MKRQGESSLHLMLLPSVILIAIFCYLPMYGIIMAFQQYNPAKGLFGAQKWVGWYNFEYIFTLPDFGHVMWNTILIAGLKIIAGLVVPVVAALLLNEIRSKWLMRGIQTMIYLPNFISWVIMAGIIIDMLSPSEGIVNQLIKAFGLKPIYFLTSNKWFVPILVLSEIWKNFGFSTIIYMASICGIDPQLYESAVIDGAGRWRQTLHITLPGMKGIIVLISVLSLGGILNAGFEQIFNLINAAVLQSGNILDLLIYNLGIGTGRFSVATAMGLFRSVIGAALISISWYLAYRVARYRVF